MCFEFIPGYISKRKSSGPGHGVAPGIGAPDPYCRIVSRLQYLKENTGECMNMQRLGHPMTFFNEDTVQNETMCTAI